MGSDSFCRNYDFEIDKIVDFVKNIGARRVLLQLPEGLQLCAPMIIKAIKEKLDNVEVYLSQNPSYGACLLDEYSAYELEADAIIHVGHVEYPYYKPRKPTLFVKASYIAIDRSRLKAILNEVCMLRSSIKICIGTTAQHIDVVKDVVKDLSSCKVTRYGIVLGCIPLNIDECDVIVVIAGGRFHCISQALYTISSNRAVDVLCIDPYTYNAWSPSKDVERIVRIRMWKVREAFDARKWLIIDGFYGQHRPHLVQVLAAKLRNLGREYVISKALRIDRELLDNIGAQNFDAIVIVACPHVAFDLYDYVKPVLTVGEALMALNGDVSRYIYPW